MLGPARTFVRFGSKEDLGVVARPEAPGLPAEEVRLAEDEREHAAAPTNGNMNGPVDDAGNGQEDE